MRVSKHSMTSSTAAAATTLPPPPLPATALALALASVCVSMPGACQGRQKRDQDWPPLWASSFASPKPETRPAAAAAPAASLRDISNSSPSRRKIKQMKCLGYPRVTRTDEKRVTVARRADEQEQTPGGMRKQEKLDLSIHVSSRRRGQWEA